MVVDTWESLTIIGWAWNTNYLLIFYIIIIYYIFISLYFQILYQPKSYWQLIFFWNGINNTSYRHIDKIAHVKLHTTLALSEHKKHIYLNLSSKPTFNTFVRTNQGVSNKNQKVMKRGGPRYKLLQL